ncbi:UDP-glucose 4-epimerase GalE [Flavobacteriaceae bacterium]|nr:UDP-glucose 4-epimerase GalE [Flavobacteriaceae bacterium]
MKILVTGGLGYIGSHVTVLLLQKGYEVISVDNLDNSSLKVLDGIESITGNRPFFEAFDVRNEDQMSLLFDKFPEIDGVIHFAAHKAVGESVENPLKYYENNISGLVQILKPVIQKSIPFIFSSSCTVYGQADQMPIDEEVSLKKAFSPYGNTKQIGEQIIVDCCSAHEAFNAIVLRYFNPIGAHPSSKIGEFPQGIPQNLIPFLTQTVIGKRKMLKVFGSNYETPDGTCIRDYIHVMDLAQAHIESLDYLMASRNSKSCEVYNVGTGEGVSVLEVINAFEKVTGEKVPYELSDPRNGDIISAYADPNKINTNIGWKARYTLEESLMSAWNWEKQLNVTT